VPNRPPHFSATRTMLDDQRDRFRALAEKEHRLQVEDFK
jgi:hypothetical protein